MTNRPLVLGARSLVASPTEADQGRFGAEEEGVRCALARMVFCFLRATRKLWFLKRIMSMRGLLMMLTSDPRLDCS